MEEVGLPDEHVQAPQCTPCEYHPKDVLQLLSPCARKAWVTRHRVSRDALNYIMNEVRVLGHVGSQS